MKKRLVLLMLSLISSSASLYGENMYKAHYNYGCQSYGKETVDSIHGNGLVNLDGTKVLGLVHVNGSLKAEESTVNSLQVNGQTDLHNCVISNIVNINGLLNANNTEFQKELSVASQKVVLRMCTVESLTIREVSGYNGIQIIDLRSGTKVLGPIVVESGNGEVWISSNSKISEGQVRGAQVFRK